MDTKTLCLGVLTLGDASGYDVRKQLMDTFSNFMEVAPSGIYPALRALEVDGHVSFERVVQDDRPNKKIYAITESGRQAFVEGLAASSGRHKVRSEMLALMFFAEHVPTDHLVNVLRERFEQLEAWNIATRDWMGSEAGEAGTAGQKFISRYALAVMKAEIEFLTSELPTLKDTLSMPDKSVRAASMKDKESV